MKNEKGIGRIGLGCLEPDKHIKSIREACNQFQDAYGEVAYAEAAKELCARQNDIPSAILEDVLNGLTASDGMWMQKAKDFVNSQ